MKEALAYPVRGAMEDRKIRLPFDPEIRADLRSVTKVVTASGNIRFTAERGENGHADRFWALALAVEAASHPASLIEYRGIPRDADARDPMRPDHAGDHRTGPGFGPGCW